MDSHACELRRAGRRIPLQIQPFRVLEALVGRAGEVVTRAELRERIWPSTVYVDFDHGLNNAINRLRHALDDSAEAPRFIETVPRVGYRFIYAIKPSAPITYAVNSHPRQGVAQRFRLGFAALSLSLAAGVGTAWLVADRENDRDAAANLPPTASADAYRSYLTGLKLIEQRNKESLASGIEHFERAIALDRNFAAAYAGLAVAYASAGGETMSRFVNAQEVRALAAGAAERALAIDPNLPDAHLALARVLDALEPWSAARDVVIEHHYRRALELGPVNENVYLHFGNFLAKHGRVDETIALHRRAYELNPLSPSINSRLGMELIALGMVEEGLERLRRTVELDPLQFNARVRLGWGYVTLGDLEAAAEAFEAAERISPDSVQSMSGLAFVAARTGDPVRARSLLDEILPLAETLDAPLNVAIVYVGLEDREKSLEWLARTARESWSLHMIGPWRPDAPIYDWLRGDARFAQIEREVAATMQHRPQVAQAF
jgi:DNA-binding winged helix-turn-helix (wHTH) protein/Tfp pilus assembly protein PilF